MFLLYPDQSGLRIERTRVARNGGFVVNYISLFVGIAICCLAYWTAGSFVEAGGSEPAALRFLLFILSVGIIVGMPKSQK
jgi:hypothetical protein